MMISASTHCQRPFIIPIFLPHAGCRHQCVFCNQHLITQKQAGLPSAKAVSETIRRYAAYKTDRRSYTQIAFYGGNFLGLAEEIQLTLLEVARQHINAGLADGIRFSTRPDTVDTERLDRLAPFPVKTIEIGVQSMDDAVLNQCRRGHTAQASQAAAALLHRRGYETGIQLMIGLPEESVDSLVYTAHQAARLAPDFIRLYPTLVLEGSELARSYKIGRYHPLSLDRAVRYTRDLYVFFHQRQIPVIRMGLQATESLRQRITVAAGPYHPAFGHLVHCRLFLTLSRRVLSSAARHTDSVLLKVHPRSLSRLQGLNSIHIGMLEKEFGLKQLRIQIDPTIPIDGLASADTAQTVTYSDLAPTLFNPEPSSDDGLMKSPEYRRQSKRFKFKARESRVARRTDRTPQRLREEAQRGNWTFYEPVKR